MTDQKTRSIDTGLGTSARTSVRLDETTWAAVDLIAEQQGKKWSEWARGVLREHPDAKNATAVLRTAAVNGLMMMTVLQNRGDDLALMNDNVLMRDSASLSEKQLNSIMETVTIRGRSDHGGFEVVFGKDDAGQDCVWIINNMRDGLHFALVAPAGAK